jgi:hypothetical protein
MNFFKDYLPRTGEKVMTKWAHYFEAYERELTRFRHRPIRFLEIGVFKGGSLPMWREFFHNESTLVFMDIDPTCKEHEIDGTTVVVGSQADSEFLNQLIRDHGPFDVILDDGSHLCPHQVFTFEKLWPHLTDFGTYMVEDTHTSYWPGFGGGYRNEASFIEYSKRVVDRMHSWYTDQDAMFPFDPIAKELRGVRFYDSIVVFEKQMGKEPPISLSLQNGQITGSRKGLEVRGRKSIFSGKDG